jgi:sugar phosphate isomerase/epimerase
VGFDEAVELAAHHAFDGIYLHLTYLKDTGHEGVVQLLDERDLKPAGWNLPFGLTAPEEEFTGALDGLAETADMCARAGALICSTWVPPAFDELTRDEAFALLAERVRVVSEVLAAWDVRLGLEFIGPETSRAGRRHACIHTMQGMLDLCQAAGTDNVGLLLDCWHLHASGGSMDDVLALAADQVVDVHVSDAPAGVALSDLRDGVRKLPGETGVIDVARFLAGLREIGYAGPVAVEPLRGRMEGMEPAAAVGAAKEALDRVWPG